MAELPSAPRPIRCAIYTRKSTEEGLDQAFNSLHAQREAGEAYVQSQAGDGWQVLPHGYDDGGFSGSNMERPAMRKLVEDVEAGRIDCVVVYKVDRLSRSLLDFARMMSVFEKHGVTFVSVTQQFNTATAVGRLTLHILFSFAQFEREIIRERTRDKKAAARRRGRWIGGYVPLGYDLDTRGGRLTVNEPEALMVRSIYETFALNGSLESTLQEIAARGWKTKTWTTKQDKPHTGRPFTEASLLRLLTNELYIGMVAYQGKLYRGEQPGIVGRGLWKRVSNIIRRLRASPKSRTSRSKALLGGLLYCSGCDKPMAHTSTTCGERRYGYYVCRTRSQNCSHPSIQDSAMENSVFEQVVRAVGELRKRPGAAKARRLRQAFGADWRQLDAATLRTALTDCVNRITYDGTTGRVAIELKLAGSRHA